MTMDKSLQIRAGLVRSRSVLTRGERIARLQSSDRWQEGQSPLGLPKVRVYKISMKKKKKRKEEEEGEGTAVAEGAAAAPAKKGAAAPAKK
ncbi:MAG TPA: small basic protein [Pirellulales bacterium]|nr:small basic protein [Pirellulales bacterium]